MIKKSFVIIVLLPISVLLNGMESPHEKTKKIKSQKSSQKFIAPSEEGNTSNRNGSKKLVVKSLDDINEMKRAQSVFRDKTILSKSENSLDKK